MVWEIVYFVLDTMSKQYYSVSSAQSTNVPEIDKSFSISHHDLFPYLQVYYPTLNEILQCDIIDLTFNSDWDPYDLDISSNIGSLSSTDLKVPTAAISTLNISNLNDFIQNNHFLFEDSDKEL